MSLAKISLMGYMVSWLPPLYIAAWGTAFGFLLVSPGILSLLTLIFSVYGLPLITYRLHQVFWPVQEGHSTMIGTDYSPWHGTHQIQLVYIAFPALETWLKLVPGLYSFWLRLWGSEIGRGVYWTPGVEVLDRGLVVIGDGAIFGHRSGMASHVITPRKGNLSLLVAKVRVGSGSFVGAGCYLGPGCVIEPGAMVPAGTNVWPKQTVSRQDKPE